jgi:hypothetical protein
MHLYLKKCAVVALCLSGVAQAATWQDLKVGAGGYGRGFIMHSDGTMVVRTDTVGAYLYNGTSWVQLVNSSSMPASFVNSVDISTFGPNGGTGGGVFEMAIAPLNSSIMYMAFDGYVFRSTNKGGTWTQTAFPQDGSMNPNQNNVSEMGQKMAVDPANSNIVYVGSTSNALKFTTDGGNTWNTAGVPAGTGYGITGILFDPSSPVVGGATQGIYAHRNGTGLYHTTNGGTTWTQTTGGPSAISYAAMTSAGLYLAVDTGADTIQSYNGKTWTNLNPGSSQAKTYHTVAVNPFNQSEIVAGTLSGQINVSYNGGSSWTGMIFGAGGGLTSADIPWLANGSSGVNNPYYYLTGGGLAFSPTTNGLLFQSGGTGMWQTTVPTNATANTAITWADFSVGIENLVTKAIVVPPSPGTGLPILISQDRPFFKITNPNVYQSTYGPVNTQLTQGWSADYASSDPTFIVGLADASVFGQPEQSGYSTDGGATWTRFATNAPGSGSGGTIAASTPQNLIWAPADRVQPSYTTNQGSSWNAINLPGVSDWSNFHFAYYLNQRSVTADRVLANTFYLYYGNYGVFKTTNGGAAWTEVHTGALDPGYYGYNSTIMSVPGNAGHLFYTSGNIGGTTPNSPRVVPFYRSTDGGATWQAVATVTAVGSFGFGAAAPGKTYPAIYIVGFVNNVYGIWQSIDNAVTWTNIGQNGTAYPLGNLELIDCISGDPNIFGRVYVGTSGGGYAYLSASGAQPIPMAPTNLTVH